MTDNSDNQLHKRLTDILRKMTSEETEIASRLAEEFYADSLQKISSEKCSD